MSEGSTEDWTRTLRPKRFASASVSCAPSASGSATAAVICTSTTRSASAFSASKICEISGRNGRRLFSASNAMKLRPCAVSSLPATPLTSSASCAAVTFGLPNSARTRGSLTVAAARPSALDQAARLSACAFAKAALA
jgi:hypothetical protein